MVTAERETTAAWGCNVEIASDTGFPSIIAREIFRKLSAAQSDLVLVSVQPDIFPSESLSEEQIDSQYAYTYIFKSQLAKEEIRRILAAILKSVKALGRVRLGQAQARRPVKSAAPSAEPAVADTAAAEPESAPRARSSMRVDLVKIEDLVNLIGELIINKNQVDALSGNILSARTVNLAETKQQIADFQAAKNQLNYVTGKLRDLALGIRMVPVGQVLRKFPAAVREMARKSGKTINVILEGADTELDKAILEEIADPLLHIIRNSVDHGIEAPAERSRKGKSPDGTVLIKAEHEGDRISVMVEDDGAGLNEEKIVRKALEKGIIHERQAEQLSKREIHQLIFSPGFSTADSISDLSGRGVGMDVVKSNIARLSGVVEVESMPDVGARITLKLPLTLSILEGLLLEDAGHMYAIPLIAIEKAYQVGSDRLKRVGRYALIEKDNQTIPVFRIAELFGHSEIWNQQAYYLIEASSPDGRFGLMVERIVGRQEIVLKPLGDYLGKITGVSGSTILGDGRVALILDTKTIADSVSEILRSAPAPAADAQPAPALPGAKP